MNRKLLAGTVLTALTCGMCNAAFAEPQHGTEAEAVAMVKRAIAAIKKEGPEKVFAQIDDPNNKTFHDRDLYIFVDSMDGVVLAHGANHRVIGVKVLNAEDADGKKYNIERIAMIKAKGEGWSNYKYYDPVTHRIEPKRSFVEGYKDLFVGCGVYVKPQH